MGLRSVRASLLSVVALTAFAVASQGCDPNQGEGDRERGYWRDVGTVDAYWEAQMDLVDVQPHFNF